MPLVGNLLSHNQSIDNITSEYVSVVSAGIHTLLSLRQLCGLRADT